MGRESSKVVATCRHEGAWAGSDCRGLLDGHVYCPLVVSESSADLSVPARLQHGRHALAACKGSDVRQRPYLVVLQ